MTKTISAKDLRLHFGKVRKDLQNGVHLLIIYRSQPIGEIRPLVGAVLPLNREEILANWPTFSLPGKKKISAVQLIRKERGY